MIDYLVGDAAEVQAQQQKNAVISEGVKIYDEMFRQKYPMLGNLFESADVQENYIGAMTSIVLRNQARFMETAKKNFGESVITSKLGDLAPRIMDVVRIFYPNSIQHIIASIQPLDQLTGQVVVIRPQYTNTAAGVTAGQEVFVNQTDGTYASEYYSQILHIASVGTYPFVTVFKPLRPATLVIKNGDGAIIGQADASGNIAGTPGMSAPSPQMQLTGSSVNNTTGVGTLLFTSIPVPTDVTIEYAVDTEQSCYVCEQTAYDQRSVNAIRQVEIGLRIIPVVAKSHPLALTWSVQAGLAAMASINLDVEDTVSTLAAQFIKIESDRQVINVCINAAQAAQGGAAFDADLVFDAALPGTGGVTRTQIFQDFMITVAKGENKIYAAAGRGSVSWMICGNNVAAVMKQLKTFVPAQNIMPIGAHVIGSLDGAITVIKDSGLNADWFVVGYNGILPGDSGVIKADWIPIYFTQTLTTKELQGQKAVLSMYDVVINNGNFYRIGKIVHF